jgi:hypothetical protein
MSEKITEFGIETRIEESVRSEIPEPMLELLQLDGAVFVSGQPLHIVPADKELPILSYNECSPVINRQVIVNKVFRQRVPEIGHGHLPEQFIDPDGYPAVQCFTFGGDEIIFGIKKTLYFHIRQSRRG